MSELFEDHYCRKFKNGLILTIFTILFNVSLAKNVHSLDDSVLTNRVSDNQYTSSQYAIERLQTAAKILKNQNPNVKPCDNFYEFTCGNYDNKYKRNLKSINRFMNPSRYTHLFINRQINNLIMNSNKVNNKSKSAELIGNLYNSCINESMITFIYQLIVIFLRFIDMN
ncbi:neprilysin-2-like [Microplitis mediator]|uniref:neprilysin-2-like n=1 Tax=Microplitis mediator TaxID=375433 RepID=UPI0025563B1E|nr:neprilysin-2-like [Microplitis mediator]